MESASNSISFPFLFNYDKLHHPIRIVTKLEQFCNMCSSTTRLRSLTSYQTSLKCIIILRADGISPSSPIRYSSYQRTEIPSRISEAFLRSPTVEKGHHAQDSFRPSTAWEEKAPTTRNPNLQIIKPGDFPSTPPLIQSITKTPNLKMFKSFSFTPNSSNLHNTRKCTWHAPSTHAMQKRISPQPPSNPCSPLPSSFSSRPIPSYTPFIQYTTKSPHFSPKKTKIVWRGHTKH